METVRLSSHSETLLGLVYSASSSVPLIGSVYHLFNFFLARGGEQRGALLSECQSGAAYSTVLHCVEGRPLLRPRPQFLGGRRTDGVEVVYATCPRLSPAVCSAKSLQMRTVPHIRVLTCQFGSPLMSANDASLGGRGPWPRPLDPFIRHSGSYQGLL